MIFNLTSGGGGGGSVLEYTGSHLISEYTSPDGTAYTLYTLTGTGTLTAKRTVAADIWICGGGNDGGVAAGESALGGAGAYCAELTGQTLKGDYTVSIAAAGGATYVDDSANTRLLETAVTSGMNGGTGGGHYSSWVSVGGTGDGVAKYPFGDSSFFRCHCAGGGAGGFAHEDTSGTIGRYDGGAGGTNGGNGSKGTRGGDCVGGAGGDYGGGAGGSSYSAPSAGNPATFYGGGGGGDGHNTVYGATQKAGGAGYQGVCYVRIPK